MVALSIIGFVVVDATAQVHTQFDQNGWTTSFSRNTALLLMAGAGVLAAFVLSVVVRTRQELPWLRWFAIAVMTLLPVTYLFSVLEAA